MPATSMLDALAQEASEIMDRQIEVAQLNVALLHRLKLLQIQIGAMAQQQAVAVAADSVPARVQPNEFVWHQDQSAEAPAQAEPTPDAPWSPIAVINLRERLIDYDGNAAQVGRAEIRVLHLLNERGTQPAGEMMKIGPVPSQAALARLVMKLNDTIAAVGLSIMHDAEQDAFTLRPIAG